MRSFEFSAKNIGEERYLTYTMGDGCEPDEDTLDYCEENEIPELVGIIFEQDDDYDYLTYNVTGLTSLADFANSGYMPKDMCLKILRNVAIEIISCKEQAIHLSYLLLNKQFMYIDEDTLKLKFLCLPIESDGSLAVEFKSFIRQFIANLMFDVEEDLSYVGQLLTYINGDSFNLRGLIGLAEALMQDAGIEYDEEENILVDGSEDEVVEAAAPEEMEEAAPKRATAEEISDIMSDLGGDVPLPEIGDDEEDEDLDIADKDPEEAEDEQEVEEADAEDEMLEDIPLEEADEDLDEDDIELEDADASTTGELTEDDSEELEEEEAEEENQVPQYDDKPETMDELKERLQKIVNSSDDEPLSAAPKPNKAIKINRAALIHNAEEEEERRRAEEAAKAAEEAAAAEAAAAEGAARAEAEKIEAGELGEVEVSQTSKNATEKKNVVTEDISDLAENETGDRPIASGILPKGTASVNNTILGKTGTLVINPYLIRVNTKERIIISKATFKIGKANRGVDYHVSGNGAISRQHAVILHKGSCYYIKDNKSTNHTFVDDVKVEDGEEALLSDKCIIRLGDEEFTFRIQ